MLLVIFFFKQKTAYEMRISDWSSDVCSSDLRVDPGFGAAALDRPLHRGLEQVPLRCRDRLAGRGVRHLGDDRHRHGNRGLAIVAVERQPKIEGIEDEMLFAKVDIAARTKRAELAVGAADINDADERVLREILLAQIIEEEALARAGLG